MMSVNRKATQKPDSAEHNPPSKRNYKDDTYRRLYERSKSASLTDLPLSPGFVSKTNRLIHCEEVDTGSVGSVPVSDDVPHDWQFIVHSACERIWACVFNNVQQANNQILRNVRDEQSKVCRQVIKHLDHTLKSKMKKLTDDVQCWTDGQISAMLTEEEEIQSAAVDEILNVAYEVTHKKSESARYDERKKAAERTQRIQRDTEKQMQRVQRDVTREKEQAVADISKRMHQDVKDITTEVQQAREELNEKHNGYQKEIDRLEEKIEELETEVRSLHKKCRDLTSRKEQIEKEIDDIQTQLKQFLDLAFRASDHSSLGQLSQSRSTIPRE